MGWQHLLKRAAKPPKNDAEMDTATIAGESNSTAQTVDEQQKLPLEEGLDHLRAARFDHAVVALRIALQREPGRFAAVRGLATAYLLSDDAAYVTSATLLVDGGFIVNAEL